MRVVYLICTISIALLGLSCSFDKPEPADMFMKRTGLKLTDSHKVLAYNDTYFFAEGEVSIILEVSSEQITSWLNKNAPWENPKWNQGPVPYEIFNCRFGYDDSVGHYEFPNDDGSPSRIEYSGPADLIDLMQNPETYWVSLEHCCEDEPNLRYHNGKLLIIEPEKGKVWYANWDY